MKKLSTFLSGIILSCTCLAQVQDSTQTPKDTIFHAATSNDVIILMPAFQPNSIDGQHLSRYNNSSILPAVNTLPGVRMEERSPNSYRFGIRGSSAQTPFGVRNIKVYYNGIPFTDAGGNTYLNNLGFYNIQGLWIDKGPTSSFYGAGLGGVLTIYSLPPTVENSAKIHYTAGSYGLQSIAGEFYINDSNSQHAIRHQHSEAQGYREQSASEKDVLSYDVSVKTGKRNQLDAHILYSKLSYQTPGGLTLAQYNADPTSARPATATIPGAVEQKATIYQESFLAGINNTIRISDKWQNRTILFASYNQLVNPTIRNFSRSSQPNTGGRTLFAFNTQKGKSTFQWVTGAEVLKQSITEKTYANNLGTPGAMTNDVEINNVLAFGFTDVEWWYKKLTISGGLSVNTLNVGISNFMPAYTKQAKKFNNEVAPGFSASYRATNGTLLYTKAAKGYTPPSVSELSPTGSNINLNLQASKGWNYEAGIMGRLFRHNLKYNITLFNFRLSQAITQRRDSAGGDFYINSGGTDQYGIEALLGYYIYFRDRQFLKDIKIGVAYTGYDFKYRNFTQLTTDYTGNKLPGVPEHVVSGSVDVNTKLGAYLNLSYYYCSRIYLNDANTEQANDYTLLGARIGYRKTIKRVLLDVFAGGDNLLNKKYSLGNDINAAGGRYYNAAPGINFFAGLTFGYKYKK